MCPVASFVAPSGWTRFTEITREVRELGGKPILATPVARRKFDTDGKVQDTHRDYPKATRLVAEEHCQPAGDGGEEGGPEQSETSGRRE